MAKKSKKVTKKVVTPKKTTGKHHHWEHHDFLLVVAGGFVVIVLIYLLSGPFRSSLPTNKAGNGQTSESAQNPMEKSIAILDFSYSENPLTVKKGTTVTWTNDDTTAHSAAADDGSFNTGMLETGESGSVTFHEAGTYTYHCSQHPSMTGTIVVEE